MQLPHYKCLEIFLIRIHHLHGQHYMWWTTINRIREYITKVKHKYNEKTSIRSMHHIYDICGILSSKFFKEGISKKWEMGKIISN